MSIPHEINFFWSWGTTLSYLRFLSLAAARHWHKDWPITLWQAKFDPDLSLGWDFGEFQASGAFGKDYSSRLKDIGVEVKTYEPTDPRVLEMPPPNVSDIFSYEHLSNHGGWYYDLDAIATKSFEYISDQAYSFVGFGDLQDWVGLFGCRPGSWVMKSFIKPALDGYDPDSYNTTGTFAIVKACTSNPDWVRRFNEPDEGMRNWRCPQDMFYPLLPQESAKLWGDGWEHSRANTWSVHMYGGNGDYALWNKKITPEFVTDTANKQWICRYVRSLGDKETFLL